MTGTYPQNISVLVRGESRAENTIRTQFEAGYEAARPRWQKALRTIELEYQYITLAELNQLRDFFESQRGGAYSFYFFHPRTGECWNCKFAEDNLSYDVKLWPGSISDTETQANARFSLTVKLKEVF